MIHVQRHERVALVRGGAVQRVLGPGRHFILELWQAHELVRYDLRELVQPLTEAEPWLLDGTRLLRVEAHQIAVLLVDGVVRRVLSPGRYRLWEAVEAVSIRWFDVHQAPVALDAGDRLHPSRTEWSEHVASPVTRLVLFLDGQPIRTLEDGRYRLFVAGPWAIVGVPSGLSPMDLAIQELVTADRIPVRVRASVSTTVVDAVIRAGQPGSANLVYGSVQLALREVVSGRTLEQLVSDRDALSDALLERSRAHLPEVGVSIEQAYVKDVILSAEVKALVGRVTLARMEAEAHSIRRREEVAATRQLANTAKLLEKSPILLRLKELEALGELAQQIDKLVVVGGGDLAAQILHRGLADDVNQ